MSARRPTALIADDEPLLRTRLAGLLEDLWPQLDIVAHARNGEEALDLFRQHRPDVCFLDVHMPGLTGIDAARQMEGATALVFVTAYDQYAVAAFARGAVDYLVKPVDPDRLAETVHRLQQRIASSQRAQVPDEVLQSLAAMLRTRTEPAWLQWIKASVGTTVRLIPVDQVVYLKADHKYTVVVWEEGEAVIRKTIRDLASELDPARFAQIHRSAIVNLRHVAQFTAVDDAGEVALKGRGERLPVSRSYLHLFQRM
ncbi:LytR/AlgR family response regulator transcription factor [Ramlibacter algicola]|uniref:Response regulator transcription factor n=1 Tax=Ramlibacter algicola TaxID=2795217 RepID=A0A934URD6_9BURK|nr:LytTR family DNA-binding domain-containing protein [Ramlibacter algicola]MBK0392756.1 response regulator transcription factor [Ramlibacter algicola]